MRSVSQDAALKIHYMATRPSVPPVFHCGYRQSFWPVVIKKQQAYLWRCVELLISSVIWAEEEANTKWIKKRLSLCCVLFVCAFVSPSQRPLIFLLLFWTYRQ